MNISMLMSLYISPQYSTNINSLVSIVTIYVKSTK